MPGVKVLPAVKAEVAAAAAATATPASRTRDLRMAGSCSLSGSVRRGWGHPAQRRLCLFVDVLTSASRNRSQLLSQKNLESLDRRRAETAAESGAAVEEERDVVVGVFVQEQV